MTDSDPSDMVDSLQASYPEYCAILQREAEMRGYIRGKNEHHVRYTKIIDAQARLIVKLTAACGKLRDENGKLRIIDQYQEGV